MHIGCAYTISGFELSTISEMPMNKASRFSGCVHSGRLLYNPSPTLGAFSGQETQKGALLLLNRVVLQRPLLISFPSTLLLKEDGNGQVLPSYIGDVEKDAEHDSIFFIGIGNRLDDLVGAVPDHYGEIVQVIDPAEHLPQVDDLQVAAISTYLVVFVGPEDIPLQIVLHGDGVEIKVGEITTGQQGRDEHCRRQHQKFPLHPHAHLQTDGSSPGPGPGKASFNSSSQRCVFLLTRPKRGLTAPSFMRKHPPPGVLWRQTWSARRGVPG